MGTAYLNMMNSFGKNKKPMQNLYHKQLNKSLNKHSSNNANGSTDNVQVDEKVMQEIKEQFLEIVEIKVLIDLTIEIKDLPESLNEKQISDIKDRLNNYFNSEYGQGQKVKVEFYEMPASQNVYKAYVHLDRPLTESLLYSKTEKCLDSEDDANYRAMYNQLVNGYIDTFRNVMKNVLEYDYIVTSDRISASLHIENNQGYFWWDKDNF